MAVAVENADVFAVISCCHRLRCGCCCQSADADDVACAIAMLAIADVVYRQLWCLLACFLIRLFRSALHPCDVWPQTSVLTHGLRQLMYEPGKGLSDMICS